MLRPNLNRFYTALYIRNHRQTHIIGSGICDGKHRSRRDDYAQVQRGQWHTLLRFDLLEHAAKDTMKPLVPKLPNPADRKRKENNDFFFEKWRATLCHMFIISPCKCCCLGNKCLWNQSGISSKANQASA